MNAKRTILHAKFADRPASISGLSDGVPLAQPRPGLRDSSVGESEDALIKARDTWRGRRSHYSSNATNSDRSRSVGRESVDSSPRPT